MSIRTEVWGKSPKGKDVHRFTLTNAMGASISVIEWGAILQSIIVPDAGSNMDDVALGFDSLARNLIRLSGFKPDVDIKIEYTGLRPGEKLYEEKLMAEEGLRMTDNKLIFIGCPIPFDTDEFLMSLESLMLAAYSNRADIKQRVAAIVNTYHPEGIPSMVKDGRYQPLEVGDRNLKTEEGKQR